MPPTNRRHGAADAPEILRTAESVVAGRISRYTLRELLNKRDELTERHRSQPDSGQD
jgi:hypothetical protein